MKDQSQSQTALEINLMKSPEETGATPPASPIKTESVWMFKTMKVCGPGDNFGELALV